MNEIANNSTDTNINRSSITKSMKHWMTG